MFRRNLRNSLAYFPELGFAAAIAAIGTAEEARKAIFSRLALDWTAYRVRAAGEKFFGLLQLISKPRQE